MVLIVLQSVVQCLCIPFFILILCFIFKFIYNFKSGICTSSSLLTGKTVLITGASSGIGKEAALDLAKRGAQVILACRNIVKANNVADEIKRLSGNNNVSVYKLDTSDLQSVRKCASKILQNESHLELLINNAGTAETSKRKMTSDGLEVIMATNHYGHFLLTNLLLGLLKKSAPSRIINVSSSFHAQLTTLDPEDLNFEKHTFSTHRAYCQSKLCNILFTLELSKKLVGSGVTANSLHPGLVDTEIFAKVDSVMMKIVRYIIPTIAKTPEMGAQTIIYLAVSEKVDRVTGKYFQDCKVAEPSKLANHGGFAKKLWLASELDVKLEENEIFYK